MRLRPPSINSPHVKAFLQQFVDVFGKNFGVKDGSAERAPQKKGASAAKQRPQRPEGEVFAGGDMGARHVVDIQDIRENEVIDVAFMTGHKHQRAFLGHGFDALQSTRVDNRPVIHGVEQPFDNDGQAADEKMIVLCGDFVEKPVGLFANGMDGLVFAFRMAGHELAQAGHWPECFL